MEIIEATLLGLIVVTAFVAVIVLVGYLLSRLFFLIPDETVDKIVDKIGPVLDNLLMVAFGMFALAVFFVACYQVGMDFLK